MKKKKAARPAKLGSIDLPARLSIAQSIELHRALMSRVESGAALLIDGSRVEEIDTAILQLLASAWMNCAERDIECKWRGTSAALRNSAALIGVSEILRFDQAI